eukprot:TRINITY_DN4950_c0_g1_i2.p1 TRINITY_DN4950_c0_g1~~TRINITY_DN4950_c0_g1_i2.p1  ORF type:complete len:104 (-),score=22.10 TRINITY_DN4950_c0_g1_i2:71-349(-)
MDENTKKTVAQIPLLRTKAGPRDGAIWVNRLKEEYSSLIKYMEINKNADNDWFRLTANELGTRWSGKCWKGCPGYEGCRRRGSSYTRGSSLP